MEKFPIPLLRSIYGTVESARFYVRERRKDSPLHCRLREASETLNGILNLEEKEEQPFWYSLYDGIIGRYVQLRTDYRYMVAENKRLHNENKELKEKYWDAIQRLEPCTNICEEL
jgi:hypothetical protein